MLAQERAVSTIRHEYTNYEAMLEAMTHARDAVINTLIYHTVKRKVLETIAEHLPELRTACLRQTPVYDPKTTAGPRQTEQP